MLPAVAWGLAGATLDPVAVESHELTHKCRINHEPVGGVTGRIPFDTGSFIDPVGVGNHQRRASQTDVNEGEAADAAPLLSFQGIVGPEGALVSLCATDIEDTCATVEIPPNALEGETILTIRPIMETTGPSSRSVPQPFLRIVSGVEIDSTVALLTRPATITLSYADFRVADSGYGAVDEATLTVFAYDPGLELWEPSVDFFLDSAANTVTFETFDLTPLPTASAAKSRSARRRRSAATASSIQASSATTATTIPATVATQTAAVRGQENPSATGCSEGSLWEAKSVPRSVAARSRSPRLPDRPPSKSRRRLPLPPTPTLALPAKASRPPPQAPLSHSADLD